MAKEITSEKVEKFLTKTGFVLEMEIVKILKSHGYDVSVNQYFLDLEEGKKREIDIIAEKKINGVRLALVVECKQSLIDSWIFICSEKKPARYYSTVKHTPNVSINNLHKKELFNDLHNFDKKIPLAQNYIVLDNGTEKKSQSIQIDESIRKLPKALIDYVSKSDNKIKTIFIPISVFSGQLFTANYEEKLNVTEADIVLFDFLLESKFYKKKDVSSFSIATIPKHEYDEAIYSFDGVRPTSYQLENMINVSEKLGNRFQINFVNKKNMSKYLEKVEENIKKISTKKWSHNIS